MARINRYLIFLVMVLLILSGFIDFNTKTFIAYATTETENYFIYKKSLAKLPYRNVDSVLKAQWLLDKLLKNTKSQLLRDKAYKDYRNLFFKIMFKIQLNYKDVQFRNNEWVTIPDERLQELKLYFKKRGYRLREDTWEYHLIEDYQNSKNKYYYYLSPSWREYLAYRVKERGVFTDDMALVISHEELRHRIIFWESYIHRYPYFVENNEIKAKLSVYVFEYLFAKYRFESDDQLYPEIKKSYENFLAYNKSSKIYPIIKKFYSDNVKKGKFMNNFTTEQFDTMWPYKPKTFNPYIFDGGCP